MNQKGLLPKEEHLLSIAEFGQAFNKDPEVFGGTYQDTGICARTNNNYFSEKLIEQIKKRGKTPTPEKPIVISLTDLKLRQDKRSEYGFILMLKEDTNLIVAPEYGTKQPITKFEIYDERGIAIPNGSGTRTIYKTNSGVSRVYSSYGQDAGAGDGRLAGSGADGRVAVGKMVVPKNLTEIEEIIAKAEQRNKILKKDLEERITKL